MDQITQLDLCIGQETFIQVGNVKFIFSASRKKDGKRNAYEFLLFDKTISSLQKELVQLEESLEKELQKQGRNFRALNRLRPNSLKSDSSYGDRYSRNYGIYSVSFADSCYEEQYFNPVESFSADDVRLESDDVKIVVKTIKEKRHALKKRVAFWLNQVIQAKQASVYRNGQVLKHVSVEKPRGFKR